MRRAPGRGRSSCPLPHGGPRGQRRRSSADPLKVGSWHRGPAGEGGVVDSRTVPQSSKGSSSPPKAGRVARVSLAIAALLFSGVALGIGPLQARRAAAAAPSAKQAAVADGADPSRTDAAGTEWLCNPDLPANPCLSNENALVQRASGRNSVQLARPANQPPIDCFYVYPTVSKQPGLAANLEIQAARSEEHTSE